MSMDLSEPEAPHDGHKLPAFKEQVNAPQRVKVNLAQMVGLDDVANIEDGNGYFCPILIRLEWLDLEHEPLDA